MRFNNHPKILLKFIEKKWCIKFIHKKNANWGWDITIEDDFYKIPIYSIYDDNQQHYNFLTAYKLCIKQNQKHTDYYHIPDHYDKGDIYEFGEWFFIRNYPKNTEEKEAISSIEVYPQKWHAFKEKMKKYYNVI